MLKINYLIFVFPLYFVALSGYSQRSLEDGSYFFTSEQEKKVLMASHDDSPKSMLSWLLAVNSNSAQEDTSERQEEVIGFIEQMKEKQKNTKHEKRFLDRVFYQGHRKFLKWYSPYTSFYNLMNRGAYDCLTGTTFYAIVLEGLELPYEVIETNYHVYLLVHGKEQPYLFESTDPLSGFVYDVEEIKKRRLLYRNEANLPSTANVPGQGYYKFSFNIEASVSTSQMVGLHYYNAAVAKFNEQKFEEALQSLDKAVFYYPATRMGAMAEIILGSVIDDTGIPLDKKNSYFKKFRSVIEKSQTTLLTKG